MIYVKTIPANQTSASTGSQQYDGIMGLALCSLKSITVDFLNQIRYFSIK